MPFRKSGSVAALLPLIVAACGSANKVASPWTIDQALFESFERDGGSFRLAWNIPLGGGTLVSGTNSFYSLSTGGLNKTPLAYGTQHQTEVLSTLDARLAIPTQSIARYVSSGAVWRLSSPEQQLVSYVDGYVRIDALATDGQTILTSTKLFDYSESSLAGSMADSAEEFLAEFPVTDWISDNNFQANARWKSGAAYLRRHAITIGDSVSTADCALSSPLPPSVGNLPNACLYGSSLENLFPISLYSATSGHPFETYFIGDGTISVRQGVRMWVASAPLASSESATKSYRVFYEFGGNVYSGILILNATALQTIQADGSAVDYQLVLNQAAVASVGAGLITGTVIPGTELVDTSEVAAEDLFHIGGHGVDGALAPSDLRLHYNVPQSLTGKGQTIAIVDKPGAGIVAADLAMYSEFYGLPVCSYGNPCLQIVDLSYGSPRPGNTAIGSEIALDVQMVHAIAPSATIILVIATGDSSMDLFTALNYAASMPGVTAVSLSYTQTPDSVATEDMMLAGFQSGFGVTVFASSGDDGHMTNYPAESPYVTAVGGTSINSVPWVSPASEVAWIYSGGGASTIEGMPTWQTNFFSPSLITANMGRRAVPDVAAVADPHRSALSIAYLGYWHLAGGTSAASPIWAGIAALFGEFLASKGTSLQELVKQTPGGFNGLLYQAKVAQGATSGFYSILQGSNDLYLTPCGVCTAAVGYNDITGLGVPNVAALFANF